MDLQASDPSSGACHLGPTGFDAACRARRPRSSKKPMGEAGELGLGLGLGLRISTAREIRPWLCRKWWCRIFFKDIWRLRGSLLPLIFVEGWVGLGEEFHRERERERI